MSIVAYPVCATCRHFEPYLVGLGECLEYVKRRQEAFARADDLRAFAREWPQQRARDVTPTDTCDRHAPRPDSEEEAS